MKYTTEQITEKFKLIHGNRYDYSKFQYLGNRIKSIIICSRHGEFLQHSNSHLSGQGCRLCAIDKNLIKFISSGWKRNVEKRALTFIESCKSKNPDLDFSKTVYNGKKHKVLVTCPIHGDYYTKSRLLLEGVSCRKCYNQNLRERWTKEGWINYCNQQQINISTFYILKFSNLTESFIKFGITSKDLKTRINKYPSSYTIEVIKSKQTSPTETWDLENYMKNKYKLYKYIPKTKFGGSSQECININILNEIKNDKTVCCI